MIYSLFPYRWPATQKNIKVLTDGFNCFWQQIWDRTQLLSAQAKLFSVPWWEREFQILANTFLHKSSFVMQSWTLFKSKCHGVFSDVRRYCTVYLFFALELVKKRCVDQLLLSIILWHWIYSLWILKQNVITFHRQHCLTSMVSQFTQTCNAINNIIRLINTRLYNGLCLLLAWE